MPRFAYILVFTKSFLTCHTPVPKAHAASKTLHCGKDHRALELLAEDLRVAHCTLGEITGEFSSDDLLGKIFSSFCIGK